MRVRRKETSQGVGHEREGRAGDQSSQINVSNGLGRDDQGLPLNVLNTREKKNLLRGSEDDRPESWSEKERQEFQNSGGITRRTFAWGGWYWDRKIGGKIISRGGGGKGKGKGKDRKDPYHSSRRDGGGGGAQP